MKGEDLVKRAIQGAVDNHIFVVFIILDNLDEKSIEDNESVSFDAKVSCLLSFELNIEFQNEYKIILKFIF